MLFLNNENDTNKSPKTTKPPPHVLTCIERNLLLENLVISVKKYASSRYFFILREIPYLYNECITVTYCTNRSSLIMMNVGQSNIYVYILVST